MHVTCAQRESLMTKGKEAQLFCSLHRDAFFQRKALKKQEKRERQLSTTSGSAFHRSTKNGASYRELSSDDEEDEGDDDDDDDDDDMEEDEDRDEDDYRSDSDDQVHDRITQEKSVPAPRRRNTSAPSSGTIMLGPKGHIKSARSLDATDRRRKERSPESEEIEVDDTEAVLGSSALGAQRKKFRTGDLGSKESPAESQRRRLLMNLDKKKKRQGSTGSSSANNLINMPIRILGGGVAVSSSTLGNGPSAEPKQKLPGISRYNNSASNNSMDTLTNPYAPPTNGLSPPVGSTERLPSNGHQSNGRGVGEGPGRAMKGVGFDADPVIDASNFKAFALGSATSSPTTPNFTNTGISQTRVGDKQKRPPRPGSGAWTEDSKEMQATVQALTEKVQQLQQQLAANNAWGSSSSAQPGDSQEKARNWTLRQNLRDLFGVLQLPVAATDAQGRNHGDVLEYNPDRLDEYVQALRDTVVRSGTQDAKRRNLVADRVLKELADMDVS
ncbi:hypothetical protein BGX34_007851 [Mortierella sp. NVP85]|nr:hypothetical protein BGX34_007851 [Mortierella sp. NVP85]